MSRLFGPIAQIGYVVKNVRESIEFWTATAGVGPWFLAEDLAYEGFTYEGVPGRLKLSVALANSGDMQLELIQPLDDAPSMFRDFLAAGREGMHHWAVWPIDYEGCVRRGLDVGLRVAQSGTSARGRWVYFQGGNHTGSILEVAEATPARLWINESVRRAARDWDGRDPIRRFPAPPQAVMA